MIVRLLQLTQLNELSLLGRVRDDDRQHIANAETFFFCWSPIRSYRKDPVIKYSYYESLTIFSFLYSY